MLNGACKHDVSTVTSVNMHISDIYLMLFAVSFKARSSKLRYHFREKTPVLSKGENFPNCLEEFRDEIDHSRSDMRGNTLFA